MLRAPGLEDSPCRHAHKQAHPYRQARPSMQARRQAFSADSGVSTYMVKAKNSARGDLQERSPLHSLSVHGSQAHRAHGSQRTRLTAHTAHSAHGWVRLRLWCRLEVWSRLGVEGTEPPNIDWRTAALRLGAHNPTTAHNPIHTTCFRTEPLLIASLENLQPWEGLGAGAGRSTLGLGLNLGAQGIGLRAPGDAYTLRPASARTYKCRTHTSLHRTIPFPAGLP